MAGRMRFIKRMAIVTGLAAAAGYVAGVLTAPSSGKETRQHLKDATNKSVAQAEKEIRRLQTEISGLVEDMNERRADLSRKSAQQVEDLIDSAKTARDKARDVLTAVRSGEAEDKDLKRAVAEANKRLDSVRKYLKK